MTQQNKDDAGKHGDESLVARLAREEAVRRAGAAGTDDGSLEAIMARLSAEVTAAAQARKASR